MSSLGSFYCQPHEIQKNTYYTQKKISVRFELYSQQTRLVILAPEVNTVIVNISSVVVIQNVET